MSLLKVKDLSISFGGLKAVDSLDFTVDENMIYGLIGPNGAGKTTVFNCLSRFYTPDTGSVVITSTKGKEIDLLSKKPYEIIDSGVVRTFQNVELIKELNVIDNMLIGMHHNMKVNFIEQLLGLGTKKERSFREKAIEILTFLGIEDIKLELAGDQPYGIQKLIELGRALMSSPRLLILDEPAAGLNGQETVELTETLLKIKERFKVSILLVEHDMGLVMKVCEKITVINFGKKIAEGTPAEIRANPVVREAYLGGDEPC